MLSGWGGCFMPSVKIKETHPRAVKKIAKRYQDNYVVAVGYPSGTKASSLKYPTTNKRGKRVKDTMRVVDVAALNEFGSASLNIPARPFMSLSKEPALQKIKPLIKSLTHLINTGKMTKKRMAKLIGADIVPVFQNTITDLKTPYNSPKTIDIKKSSNPLIDSGIMRNTLTFGVRKIDK